jgi:dCMP deaminase
MGSALLFAQRGTCSRAQVGAVISVGSRILVSGYNGAPAGMPHCDHISCSCATNLIQHRYCPQHSPCTRAVHAEANALAFAARYGVCVEGATLHTTRVPCLTCAGLIINSGIRRVVWGEEHRDMAGLSLLASAELEVVEYRHADF